MHFLAPFGAAYRLWTGVNLSHKTHGLLLCLLTMVVGLLWEVGGAAQVAQGTCSCCTHPITIHTGCGGSSCFWCIFALCPMDAYATASNTLPDDMGLCCQLQSEGWQPTCVPHLYTHDAMPGIRAVYPLYTLCAVCPLCAP